MKKQKGKPRGRKGSPPTFLDEAVTKSFVLESAQVDAVRACALEEEISESEVVRGLIQHVLIEGGK